MTKGKREGGKGEGKQNRCHRVKREFVLNTYVLCSIQECAGEGERSREKGDERGPRCGGSASMFY